MITNRDISTRAAAVNTLRAKGKDYLMYWCNAHQKDIAEIYSCLFADSTNYNPPGISTEARSKIILEYAVGEVFLSKLPESEREAILLDGVKLYNRNSAALGRLLLALIAYIALILLSSASIASRYEPSVAYLFFILAIAATFFSIKSSSYVLKHADIDLPRWFLITLISVNLSSFMVAFPLSEWASVKKNDGSIDDVVLYMICANTLLAGFFIGVINPADAESE